MSDKTCLDFMKNPNINPVTGRKIKLNGPVYKKLEKRCYSHIFNNKKKRKKIYQDFLYPVNPETGRKIKLNGVVYKKLKKKYESIEITSPKYIISENPNIQETIIVSGEKYDIPKYIKNWIVGKKIGSGGFGSVYQCTHKYKNTICVIKFTPKNSYGIENEMKFYIESFGKKYKFLPQCFDMGIYGDLTFIIMEKLYPFIFDFKKIPELYFIFKKFFLEFKRSHGDVKFNNIMVRRLPNKKEDIVLIDFGMSFKFDGKQKIETVCGTPVYLSRNSIHKIITNQNDLESLCYCILDYKYILPWDSRLLENKKNKKNLNFLLNEKENFVKNFIYDKIPLKEIDDNIFEFIKHIFIISNNFISEISYKYLDNLVNKMLK